MFQIELRRPFGLPAVTYSEDRHLKTNLPAVPCRCQAEIMGLDRLRKN